MNVLFFELAMTAYLVVAVLFMVFLAGRRETLTRACQVGTVIGFTFHTAALVQQGVAVGGFPVTNSYEAASFFSWTLVAVFLLFDFKYKSHVLGEPQILGQFKDAFETALTAKSTGMVLNKIAKKAISVAKRVRTETKIAENAVSISYAAVELARKVFSDLSQQKVMLLGAGEMAELALRYLMAAGVSDVIIANRTLENAEKLACSLASCESESHIRAMRFDDYPDALHQVDIVLCSTGARDYVIGPEQVGKAIKIRKNRPMFLIDISVPRNIDPATDKLGGAYVYDVDDLQSVVQSNLEERQEEAKKALKIVDDEVEGTARWIRSLEVVPTITALKGHAESIAQKEVERVLARLSHLSEKERKLIESLGPSIINKLLHQPLSSLRREAQERDGRHMVETTRKLFALPEDAPPANATGKPKPVDNPDDTRRTGTDNS